MVQLRSALVSYSFLMNHPLTRRHRLKAAMRVARWQVLSRMHDGFLIVPFVNDLTLVARRGLTGATGNIYVGLHEFHDMAFVGHFLRPADLFCDVGANTGSYSVLASGVTGCRTAAFEPSTATRRLLRWNTCLNALEGLIQIHDVALSDKTSEVNFSTKLGSTNRIVGANEAPSGSEVVSADTLDNVLAGEVPAVVKIDVEGHEPSVLAGGTRILSDARCKAVIIETVSNCDLIEAELARYGFSVAYYDPFRRQLSSTKPDGRKSSVNRLMIRDALAAEERVVAAKPMNVLCVAV